MQTADPLNSSEPKAALGSSTRPATMSLKLRWPDGPKKRKRVYTVQVDVPNRMKIPKKRQQNLRFINSLNGDCHSPARTPDSVTDSDSLESDLPLENLSSAAQAATPEKVPTKGSKTVTESATTPLLSVPLSSTSSASSSSVSSASPPCDSFEVPPRPAPELSDSDIFSFNLSPSELAELSPLSAMWFPSSSQCGSPEAEVARPLKTSSDLIKQILATNIDLRNPKKPQMPQVTELLNDGTEAVGEISDCEAEITLSEVSAPSPIYSTFSLPMPCQPLTSPLEKLFARLNFAVCVQYGTNVSSSCAQLIANIARTYHVDHSVRQTVESIVDVLVLREPRPPRQVEFEPQSLQAVATTSTANAALGSEISRLMTVAFINYLCHIVTPGSLRLTPLLGQIRRLYAAIGDLGRFRDNPDIMAWTKLFFWYDGMASMMIGRRLQLPRRYKQLAYQYMPTVVDVHDSDLYANIGCPDGLASVLVDVAFVAGEHGLDAFEHWENIPAEVWREIEALTFRLHTWSESARLPRETALKYELRMALHSCWRWAGLIYVYTVFYRNARETEKVQWLAEKIFATVARYPRQESKQLLWPMFVASCQVAWDDMERQAMCLDILDSWYVVTNGTALYKTTVDVLMEVWNTQKEKQGEGFVGWWVGLVEKYYMTGYEAIFT